MVFICFDGYLFLETIRKPLIFDRTPLLHIVTMVGFKVELFLQDLQIQEGPADFDGA